MAEYAVADVVMAAATTDVTEYASKSEIHTRQIFSSVVHTRSSADADNRLDAFSGQ